jgi:hypothetical protein
MVQLFVASDHDKIKQHGHEQDSFKMRPHVIDFFIRCDKLVSTVANRNNEQGETPNAARAGVEPEEAVKPRRLWSFEQRFTMPKRNGIGGRRRDIKCRI